MTANVGASTITVKDSVSNWPIGGLIVIATTGDYLSQGETETRVITAINNNVITLDKPLSFTHLSVTRTVADTSVSIVAEVGLLTRNILYQGIGVFSFNSNFSSQNDKNMILKKETRMPHGIHFIPLQRVQVDLIQANLLFKLVS